LIITIAPPSDPASYPDSKSYEITISSRCSTSLFEKGLLFSTAGKDQIATVTYSSSSKPLKFFVSPKHFTTATAISFWSNAG